MPVRENMETDTDVVAACKTKLLQFRIKELKDVLSQVGLSKQGRKQDLTDRILALLYDEGTPGVFKNNVNGKEGLIEIIDQISRNMHDAGGSDSNSKKHNSSSSSRLRPKEEVDESFELEKKVQCPCGSDLPYGSPLVQCVDPGCSIWQHRSCVIIPERPTETISTPANFLCEMCRVKRSDPFWAAMAHPLSPVKLVPASIPVDGTNPHVSVEKTFKLTKADRDLLQKKAEYGVQVWCMLFNDTVPYRIQWPQYADLQVNGNPVKTLNRPVSQQLGANGRDDGAKIASYVVEGVNKISLSFTDARSFCFGVRLVRRRTLEQVLGMIPKENDGEPFEDALSRIRRCIGGGITPGKDDSDSDLEVIADSVPVSLRCPVSGSRMKTAGRFRPCAHMGCFDLETFVGINERTRKWQCPICLKNYSLEDLIVDPFFNRIMDLMGSCAEEINEIELKPDGCWRVKRAREAGNLAKWHKADGSVEESPESDAVKEHEKEYNSLALNTQNHVVDASLLNQGNGEAENQVLDIISMSSTTSGNGVNQNDNDHNEPEVSSRMNYFGQNHTDADIIVLSDSEDDDVSLVYPESAPVVSPPNHDGHSTFSADEKLGAFSADAPTEGPSNSSGIVGDRLTSQTSFPHSLGAFEVGHLGTSSALPSDYDSAFAIRHINEELSLGTTLDPVCQVIDSFVHPNDAFDFQLPNGDNSLDITPSPSGSRDELPLVNVNGGESWNFLDGGGNGQASSSNHVEAQHQSTADICVDLQNQSNGLEDPLIQRSNGDSESLSPSGSGSDPSATGRKRDGPFSFPRQPRTVRRRTERTGSSSVL